MIIKQDPNRLDIYLGQSDKEPRVRKKKCRICKEFKPITEFNDRKQMKDGLKSFCKKCAINKRKKNKEKNKKKNKDLIDKKRWHGRSKRCPGIKGIYKPHILPAIRENFSKNDSRFDGLDAYCKKCTTASSWQLTYKQSFNVYLNLYNKQKGICFGCGNHFKKIGEEKKVETLQTHHDHNTDEIKALLCKECNTNLGILESEKLLNILIPLIFKFNASTKKYFNLGEVFKKK